MFSWKGGETKTAISGEGFKMAGGVDVEGYGDAGGKNHPRPSDLKSDWANRLVGQKDCNYLLKGWR